MLRNPISYIEHHPYLFTVVDGQPFYQSTGRNSDAKGTWLPLIMVQTHTIKDTPRIISDTLDTKSIFAQELSCYFIRGYLVKHELCFVKELDCDLDETYAFFDMITGNPDNSLKIRLVTKRDILTSIRLGGGIWKNHDSLDMILKIIGYTREDVEPFQFKHIPEFVAENEEEINQWLIDQGATDLNYLYHQNPILTPAIQELNELLSQLEKKLKSSILSEYSFYQQNEAKEQYKNIYNLLAPLHDLITNAFLSNSDVREVLRETTEMMLTIKKLIMNSNTDTFEIKPIFKINIDEIKQIIHQSSAYRNTIPETEQKESRCCRLF